MSRSDLDHVPSIIVMGVSGCGKSSVGQKLSEHLGLSFIEADQLHLQANIVKMSQGVALTDDERAPWLDLIGDAIKLLQARGEHVVVSCSALKPGYRDRLRMACNGRLFFVYLSGSRELLCEHGVDCASTTILSYGELDPPEDHPFPHFAFPLSWLRISG
ncbi:gluconokinase, GntK/IdnK-type [Rhizobium sp. ZPR3]|uniref:Gluconokinase n=2 Tax=unclassified Rhizobium TaxID=2613769 RepID=A0AAU7SPZ3_9HYPH